jgi:hypothetical protein
MELHHIKPRAQKGADSYDNCIPLCFDCHADVGSYNPKHPKGRKYSERELQAHRDKWYQKVKNTEGSVLLREDYLELDRKLFVEIRNIIPTTGRSFYHLCEFDYGGAFELEIHDPLRTYWVKCKLPEFEFMDSDLEGQRASLESTIEEFLEIIGHETFHVKGSSPHRNRVPDEYDSVILSQLRRQSESEEDFNQKLRVFHKSRRQTIKHLNELSTEICDMYKDFIRLGRRKLGV